MAENQREGAAAAAPPSRPGIQQFADRLFLTYRRTFESCTAMNRAVELLYDHCTPAQRQEVLTTGRLTVIGSGMWSRGQWRQGHYVFNPNPHIIYNNGRQRRFCITEDAPYGAGRVPYADVLLAHKIMLESDERRWRQIANRL